MLERACVIVALAASACSGAPKSVMCGGAERPSLDCEGEVEYQGKRAKGGASFLSISAHGEYEETAIRRINEHVEKYVAAQRRLCDEYNKCVVDAEKYRAEAAELRARLVGLTEGAGKLEQATSYGARKEILASLYETAVPAEARPEECALRMRVEAELPAGVGQAGAFTLAPNEPLPTGAFVAFELEVTVEAHLYILQDSPESGAAVLFPHKEIGLGNPLPAGKPVRIPPGKDRFELDDKDIGSEWLYIVVSRKPVARMEQAISRVAAGQVKRMADDETLAALKSMAPGTLPAECTERALVLSKGSKCAVSRGLVLKKNAAGDKPASIALKTDPGDDMIVKAFPYRHVKKGDYAAAIERFRGSDGATERAVVIED